MVAPSDRGYDAEWHLSFADVRADTQKIPEFLQVTIKASKTDPFRKGVTIFLGRTQDELCPVAATLQYMVRRGSGPGPLFMFSEGRYLTRDRFVSAVRSGLTMAGINASLYAGHSFWIGAATTAAQRGIQDSLIKTLGRWESSAYTIYTRYTFVHLGRPYAQWQVPSSGPKTRVIMYSSTNIVCQSLPVNLISV